MLSIPDPVIRVLRQSTLDYRPRSPKHLTHPTYQHTRLTCNMSDTQASEASPSNEASNSPQDMPLTHHAKSLSASELTKKADSEVKLTKQLKDKEEDVENLLHRLQECEHSNKTLHTENARLSEQCKHTQQKAQDQAKSNHAQIKHLQDASVYNKREYDRIVKHLMHRLEERENSNDKLGTENARLMELCKHTQRIQVEIKKAQDDAKSREAHIRQVEEAFEYSKLKIGVLQGDLKSKTGLETKNAQLVRHIKHVEGEYESLMSRNGKLKSEHAQLASKAESERRENKEAITALKQQEGQVKSAERRVTESRMKVDRVNAEMEKYLKDGGDLVKTADGDVRETHAYVAELEEAVNAWKEATMGLREDVGKCQALIEEKDYTIKASEEEMRRFRLKTVDEGENSDGNTKSMENQPSLNQELRNSENPDLGDLEDSDGDAKSVENQPSLNQQLRDLELQPSQKKKRRRKHRSKKGKGPEDEEEEGDLAPTLEVPPVTESINQPDSRGLAPIWEVSPIMESINQPDSRGSAPILEVSPIMETINQPDSRGSAPILEVSPIMEIINQPESRRLAPVWEVSPIMESINQPEIRRLAPILEVSPIMETVIQPEPGDFAPIIRVPTPSEPVVLVNSGTQTQRDEDHWIFNRFSKHTIVVGAIVMLFTLVMASCWAWRQGSLASQERNMWMLANDRADPLGAETIRRQAIYVLQATAKRESLGWLSAGKVAGMQIPIRANKFVPGASYPY